MDKKKLGDCGREVEILEGWELFWKLLYCFCFSIFYCCFQIIYHFIELKLLFLFVFFFETFLKFQLILMSAVSLFTFQQDFC